MWFAISILLLCRRLRREEYSRPRGQAGAVALHPRERCRSPERDAVRGRLGQDSGGRAEQESAERRLRLQVSCCEQSLCRWTVAKLASDYRTEDMLAIFFPHMFEDIEFLIPPEELAQDTSAKESAPPDRMATRRAVQENAVAGPSRLR